MADIKASDEFKVTGPQMLPVVTLSDGKTYFIDARLHQLRNVNNPSDFIADYMNVLNDIDKVRVNRCKRQLAVLGT